MIAARIKELIALTMIGEGVIGMLDPKGHLRLWRVRPRPLRKVVDWSLGRPGLMRARWVGQIGLGVLWAMRLLSKEA
jgi:hypothetical protein